MAAEINVSSSLQVGAGQVTLPFVFSASITKNLLQESVLGWDPAGRAVILVLWGVFVLFLHHLSPPPATLGGLEQPQQHLELPVLVSGIGIFLWDTKS